MDVLVTGAAGMLGRKLVDRIAAEGIGGTAADRLTLLDVVAPAAPDGFAGAVDAREVDLTAPGAAAAALAGRPDVIFHLAAIVSGEAEADLEKGYRVNLDATRALFDAIRTAGGGWRPRVVFASSIGVYGGPFPAVIDDDFQLTPQTSYGTQKLMGEAMLCDFSRRGIFDGIAIRLPTICIRPGRPNKAASGFLSNILREPLVGEGAVLPVEDNVRSWLAGPRAAIGFLTHAAAIDLSPLGPRRGLMMPGISASIGEQLAALERVAGARAVALVRREPDAAIRAIVATWPERFDPQRATALGFHAETSLDELIHAHIQDELGGRIPN